MSATNDVVMSVFRIVMLLGSVGFGMTGWTTGSGLFIGIAVVCLVLGVAVRRVI